MQKYIWKNYKGKAKWCYIKYEIICLTEKYTYKLDLNKIWCFKYITLNNKTGIMPIIIIW